MVKVLVGTGKEQKEYQLELSFNTVVETDFMEQAGGCQAVMDDLKKSAKSKNFAAQMKASIKMMGMVRYLLFVCLQDNHSEEITSEKQAGTLVQRLITENKKSIIDIYNIINECLEEADFLSKLMGTEENPPIQPQDHLPKVVK
ncbi:hypothetical protein [Enterocloster citroniae]|jgi:ribosome-binding ATPase YchF (GTP1/OBG family)|uniref:hypothetical protein n=1 Tax=Enterocloster citroniae TaxID=358743 RepID=UPI0022E5D0D3|nr:hypothetical protein [Enterocloster citroniae]